MPKVLCFFSILFIYHYGFARVSFVEECVSEGKKLCYVTYETGLAGKGDKVKSVCSNVESADVGAKICLAYKKNKEDQLSPDEKKRLADQAKRNNERLLQERTVELTRAWRCSGSNLGSRAEIEITTIKTPKTATSKEFETTYRRVAKVDFDCNGDAASVSIETMRSSDDGKRLRGGGSSINCNPKSKGAMIVDMTVPMGNGQPLTPIKMRGYSKGDKYNMDLTNCTFKGSKVTRGGESEGGHRRIRKDDVPFVSQ